MNPADASHEDTAPGGLKAAPMPGTPLPQQEVDRLKQRAKSTRTQRRRGQSDPSAKE